MKNTFDQVLKCIITRLPSKRLFYFSLNKKIIDKFEIYCNRTSLFNGLALATLKRYYRHSIIRDQECFDIVMEIEFPNGNTAYYTIACVSVDDRNEWNLEVNKLLTR